MPFELLWRSAVNSVGVDVVFSVFLCVVGLAFASHIGLNYLEGFVACDKGYCDLVVGPPCKCTVLILDISCCSALWCVPDFSVSIWIGNINVWPALVAFWTGLPLSLFRLAARALLFPIIHLPYLKYFLWGLRQLLLEQQVPLVQLR